jgi:hypothetical protein
MSNGTIGIVGAVRGAGSRLCTPDHVSAAQAVSMAHTKGYLSLLKEGRAEYHGDLIIFHAEKRVED